MTWLFRAVFVALLAVTIAWKLTAPPITSGPQNVVSGLDRVLQGRLTGPITSRPSDDVASARLLYFAPVTGCPAPLVITTGQPSAVAAAFMRQFQQPGDSAQLAYLTWIGPTPDRWMLLRLRLQNQAAAMVGLSPFIAANQMLFISAPAGCAGARTLPWRRFWLRG
jgi:hypothetical protein